MDKKPKTTGHLDYLSVTFDWGFDVSQMEQFVGKWKESGRGGHGYEKLEISANGAIAQSRGTRAMGVHVDIKGELLSIIRSTFMTDKELIEWVKLHGGRASRIDVCVNIVDDELEVQDLWLLWQKKQVVTRARLAKRYYAQPEEGTDDGFYIGSKDSDKFMRIYDKGRQLGLRQKWIRVELQSRKSRARAIQRGLEMTDKSRDLINRALLDYCAFVNETYIAALEGHDDEIPPIPRSEPQFYKWLRTQVAPAMLHRELQNAGENPLAVLEKMIDDLRLSEQIEQK
ncbi:MAG: replication initiation factor domain-containing protein [Candidatus Eremiobacteraeota bacterium]|nr:replication initiation factor domain-containing protein [Candidatus Eremiobacteraeota bacterium]